MWGNQSRLLTFTCGRWTFFGKEEKPVFKIFTCTMKVTSTNIPKQYEDKIFIIQCCLQNSMPAEHDINTYTISLIIGFSILKNTIACWQYTDFTQTWGWEWGESAYRWSSLVDLTCFPLLISISVFQAFLSFLFLSSPHLQVCPRFGHPSTLTFGNDTCRINTFSETRPVYNDLQFTKPWDTPFPHSTPNTTFLWRKRQISMPVHGNFSAPQSLSVLTTPPESVRRRAGDNRWKGPPAVKADMEHRRHS